MSDLKKAASGLADAASSILDKRLDELGEMGQELRERTHRLLQLTSEVYLLELAGVDATTEKQALEASRLALEAAGKIHLAASVRAATIDAVRLGFRTILGLLI